VLAGGETIVHVANSAGYGGRNQEVVLGALPHLDENTTIISAASDGWDNTDVAGAIGDKLFYTLAVDKRLDVRTHLRDNTSYTFFTTLGAALMTGRTGSNVSDLFIVLRV
jgi:hydroxypyruvate reductase/glycerate 2-kinase